MPGSDFNIALKSSQTGWVYRQRSDGKVVMFFYDWQGFIGEYGGQRVRKRKHYTEPTDYVDWLPVERDAFASYRENASRILGIPFEGAEKPLPVVEALKRADTGCAYRVTSKGVHFLHHSGTCFLIGRDLKSFAVTDGDVTQASWFPINKPMFSYQLESIEGLLPRPLPVSEIPLHEDYDIVPPPETRPRLRDLISQLNSHTKTIADYAQRLQNLSLMDLDEMMKITEDMATELERLRSFL